MSERFTRTWAAVLTFAGGLGLAACTGGIQSAGSGGEVVAGFTVGGTVSGLSGQGLTLQNNGGNTLTVTASGPFTFDELLLPGNSYSVVVSGQPTAPVQTCAVTNGLGTVSTGNITNIKVVCAAKTGALDTIGGTVSGDLGTGLVLQNNGGDNITVVNGAFTFPTALPSGFPYDVTVLSPPLNPYQNCTVTNASGTTATTDVNDVTVSCVTNNNPTQTIGGTITGLTAADATIVLEDNGRDPLTLSKDGAFNFSLPIPTGSFYNVMSTSLTGPVSLTCSFTDASGLVGSTAVTGIEIACVPESSTPLTPVAINVSGLVGSGLVLEDNGTDDLPITMNGTFSFSVALPSGTGYAVTVLTQPTNPTQLCTVTDGTGTVEAGVPITVNVACVTAYTIGGTVEGYSTGTGLTLQDNGGAVLALSANGAFTFPTPVLSGDMYNVTIASQPTGPPTAPVPTCVVQAGSGTVATTNVTSVVIDCTVGAGPPTNEWTWIGGTDLGNQGGIYGTLGSPALGNVPGGRFGAVSWFDNDSGQFWLFGGNDYDGYLNDLWLYDPEGGLWTWMGGSNSEDAAGVYGTQGVAAPGNVPGARSNAVSWTDPQGNFWLFGGDTYPGGIRNDLWEYSPNGSGNWTWVSGSNMPVQTGVYGTLGVPAAGNVPGARESAVSWVDAQGNLWLFGGLGYAAGGFASSLNDLWRFTPSSGLWTWMGGSNATGAMGVYGTQGTAAATNVPGARQGPMAWTDPSGNFWLLGGNGHDSTGNIGNLNDLWLYNPSTNEWTWKAGSNIQGAVGSYGTLGVGAAGNTPGGRQAGATWVDNAGNLWLFGGTTEYAVDYNDLWEYSPSTGFWAWTGGPNTTNSTGSFGTEGMAASSNVPPSRDTSVTWVDGFGNFYLFGGNGFVVSDPLYPSVLNDLWKYVPP